ncbi:methyltransferase domain-containing protein [Streptomyces sp. RB6PN25]|uniref:Methyltransferase domain-containing protein n=1 Tax=Streptomyces humicola TaxID=2953240 RepID=A0ABT1Q1A0_9ACTN|nr:class I SAM-dependent methyltransferase [Streptomyces humicola]MCQ4083138.1 methyltransferase domain-containing protein [Streptomyces humicola]
MTDATSAQSAEQFWEERYQGQDRAWSGKPNEPLVRETASLSPGTALDLGCGEGADAIWLAEQGWRVTAVDLSATALRRAAAAAADAGVAERIDWQRHDLSATFPQGRFDLVSAQFLHSPVAAEGERPGILRRAADAVAEGGVLLIVGHAGWPSWQCGQPPFHYTFPTTGDVLDQLALPDGEWEVETEDEIVRDAPDPEGRPGTRTDNILKVRRTAGRTR